MMEAFLGPVTPVLNTCAIDAPPGSTFTTYRTPLRLNESMPQLRDLPKFPPTEGALAASASMPTISCLNSTQSLSPRDVLDRVAGIATGDAATIILNSIVRRMGQCVDALLWAALHNLQPNQTMDNLVDCVVLVVGCVHRNAERARLACGFHNRSVVNAQARAIGVVVAIRHVAAVVWSISNPCTADLREMLRTASRDILVDADGLT